MSVIKRLWVRSSIKRIAYLLVLLAVWQIVYRCGVFPEILFPGPQTVFDTLVRELADLSLLRKAGNSLLMIVYGLLLSLAMVFVFTVLAMLNKSVRHLADTLISVLDPLPGIALLPLAILWFGVGSEALLFVMVHSILWPVLLNIMTGFDTVPAIYREIGMGIGLSKFRIVTGILIPAAFPSILSGLKTGWSRAWRALISSEMVFGATGSSSGLGWDIYLKRSYLDMPGMFACLIVIMIIGILVDDFFFKRLEKSTIVKWGMTR